jgi:hypothetical protein
MTQHYTDDQLLAMAMGNLGTFIETNTRHYILVEDDPRNEEDYDTWSYGTEPVPGDETWKTGAIEVDAITIDDALILGSA